MLLMDLCFTALGVSCQCYLCYDGVFLMYGVSALKKQLLKNS